MELNPERGTLPETRLFLLLPDSTQLSESAYVGRLRAVITHEGRSTLDKLYPALRERANELGANSFKASGDCGGPEPCEITADLFVAPSEVIDRGPAPLPADAVFVFGDLDANSGPARFKLNDEQVEVPPLRYVKYPNTGEELTISVGGMLGAALTLKGGEGRDPSFWSLSNFGVGPAPGGGLGMSFNTGRIYPVETAIGRFLISVLEEVDV